MRPTIAIWESLALVLGFLSVCVSAVELASKGNGSAPAHVVEQASNVLADERVAMGVQSKRNERSCIHPEIMNYIQQKHNTSLPENRKAWETIWDLVRNDKEWHECSIKRTCEIVNRLIQFEGAVMVEQKDPLRKRLEDLRWVDIQASEDELIARWRATRDPRGDEYVALKAKFDELSKLDSNADWLPKWRRECSMHKFCVTDLKGYEDCLWELDSRRWICRRE